MPFYAEYKKAKTRNRFIAIEFSRRRDAIRRAKDYALIYGKSQVLHVRGDKAVITDRFKRVRK